MTNLDILIKIIQSETDTWDEPLDEVHDIPKLAKAITTHQRWYNLLFDVRNEGYYEGYTRGYSDGQ